MKRSTNLWKRLLVIVTLVVMLVPATALAVGPPPGKGETGTLPNNLSVPAIFVPNEGAFAVTCPGGPTDPTGDPINAFEIAPLEYYYVQGMHSWQAQCAEAAVDTVSATADWGDNLEGTALKAGMPIRVEVGLIESTGTQMTGYRVIKLEPSLLDRESDYGTLATPVEGGGFTATQTTFPWTGTVINPETGLPETVTVGVRVWDSTAKFSIRDAATGAYVVPEQLFGAEINATGAVVYGYNWGVSGHGIKDLPQAGTYILKFTSPAVSLTNHIEGDVHSAELTFTLAPKNNGGGKSHGH